MNDGDRHPLFADVEIAAGALGLSAPQPIGRHLDWSEGVGLCTRLDHGFVLAACARVVFACRGSLCALHFLRKRSRLTTSPPLAGLCGSSSDGVSCVSLAGCGTAATAGVVRVCFVSAAGCGSLAAMGAPGAVVSVEAAVAAGVSATCSNLTANG